MSQEIAAILDDFAARFGTTGARLWEQLVLREVAMALAVPASFLVMALLFLGVRTRIKDKDGRGVLVVATVIASVLFIAFTATAVVTLAAPEAAVIKGLLP